MGATKWLWVGGRGQRRIEPPRRNDAVVGIEDDGRGEEGEEKNRRSSRFFSLAPVIYEADTHRQAQREKRERRLPAVPYVPGSTNCRIFKTIERLAVSETNRRES